MSHPTTKKFAMSAADKTLSIITLFLAGDVMTGRGIDQILPHPCDPTIFESYMKDARGYVFIAERKNGDIPKPVSMEYIWGDGLSELQRRRPHVKIINLETSVTTSESYWKYKGINYRMNPANAGCLSAAGIDCCTLANNHILDWGYEGLHETIETMTRIGVATAGVGETRSAAERPAVVPGKDGKRTLVFAFGFTDSGIVMEWEATECRPGTVVFDEYSEDTLTQIKEMIERHSRPGDLIVASVHWGPNWGYTIPSQRRKFAHNLLDRTRVHLIHGHSSHHPLAVEVHNGKLIIYGAGDLISDYEGISGHDEFRGDLCFMYFPEVCPNSGDLQRLTLVPMQMKNFKLNHPSDADVKWMQNTWNSVSAELGTQVQLEEDGTLSVHWE